MKHDVDAPSRKACPMYRNICIRVILSAICGLFMLSCSQDDSPQQSVPKTNPDLAAHSDAFVRQVIEVTDGVHVAVGFGLANSVLLVGDDGVVIIDTMESAEAARPVKQAFEGISSKPVKAIIYTHFHSDHTFGTKVMAGTDNPVIVAHAKTSQLLDRVVTVTRDTTYRRAMRQFGTLLPKDQLINAGIGPFLLFDNEQTPAFMRPTKTFSGESLELTIAGIRLVLRHAPGETPDQIFVWLPQKKVLLPADNFYESFPNLYAIRGTAYRDVTDWVRSLDKMRRLPAEYLVPHHTMPIIGAQPIYETLTNYRDAIQFVHDQTIRWMNKGLSPDEIIAKVSLPPHLAAKPYLQEYYGTVPWSVRAIFNGYLGWFGGNATDLFPLSAGERARKLAEMAGGSEALLQQAQSALDAKESQWALELSDHLLQIGSTKHEAREIKAAALVQLAGLQTAATARNYYLTQSLEILNKLHIGKAKSDFPEMLHNIPLDIIFNAMAVSLDVDKSADVDTVAGFRFPDTGEAYGIHVRRGVAEIQPHFPDNPDIILTVDSKIWKEIAAGMRNPTLAFFKDIKKEGGIGNIKSFLTLFKE
jgi:alkyl sulfatase BDS1-like metallo-beta-lactamase superfamily hydrolase